MIKYPRFSTNLKPLPPETDAMPFLGVLFLLLMFFSIAVTTVQVSGIKISLPQSQVTEQIFTERSVITVDKDNKVFWNDRLINDIKVELGKEFNEMKIKDAESKGENIPSKRHTVVLRCDVGAEYKTPMEIIALAFSNDINVVLATAPESKKETDYDAPSPTNTESEKNEAKENEYSKDGKK